MPKDKYLLHQGIGELLFRLERYEEALQHFRVLPGKHSINGFDEEEEKELRRIANNTREVLITECKLILELKKVPGLESLF